MLASVSAAMSTSLLPSVVIQRLPKYLPIIHLVFAESDPISLDTELA